VSSVRELRHQFLNIFLSALLGFYTQQNGNSIPMLWYNQSVPSSRVKQSKTNGMPALEDGTGKLSEMSGPFYAA